MYPYIALILALFAAWCTAHRAPHCLRSVISASAAASAPAVRCVGMHNSRRCPWRFATCQDFGRRTKTDQHHSEFENCGADCPSSYVRYSFMIHDLLISAFSVGPAVLLPPRSAMSHRSKGASCRAPSGSQREYSLHSLVRRARLRDKGDILTEGIPVHANAKAVK